MILKVGIQHLENWISESGNWIGKLEF